MSELKTVEKMPEKLDFIPYQIFPFMIDHNGHVNFRHLCVLFEKGFSEFVKNRKVSHEFLVPEFGKTTFFRHQEIDYLGELHLETYGSLVTGITEVKNSSFIVH